MVVSLARGNVAGCRVSDCHLQFRKARRRALGEGWRGGIRADIVQSVPSRVQVTGVQRSGAKNHRARNKRWAPAVNKQDMPISPLQGVPLQQPSPKGTHITAHLHVGNTGPPAKAAAPGMTAGNWLRMKHNQVRWDVKKHCLPANLENRFP